MRDPALLEDAQRARLDVSLVTGEEVGALLKEYRLAAGLTHGAYSAILAGGSDAQKAAYLPKLASGQWGGTMNLTEPQCGTDLGLLRTKAVDIHSTHGSSWPRRYRVRPAR